MKKVAIYALLDKDGHCRYIGKTIMPKIRFADHQKKRSWAVRMIVLEWVGAEWAIAEKFWIKTFREAGHPIENKAEGGAGPNGWKMPSDVVARIVMLRKQRGNYKLTASHKEALRIANTGRIVSQATRNKIGKAGKGRKLTQEHRAKLQEAWRQRKVRGWKFSDSAIEKIKLCSLGRKHTAETKRKLR